MKAIRSLVVMGLAVVVGGCASLGTQQSPEETIADRALERRQALIDGDFETAYEFLSPGFRANNSLERYKARFGSAVRWTDAEVQKVTCQAEDACVADVLVSYTIKIPRMPKREGQRPIMEDWILADGTWWYLPAP